MTQAAVPAYTFHLGDGVTTTFPYSWFLAEASELQVYAGAVLTTAYTLTGVQTPAGGNVIFYTPPPNGTILFLVRVTPQTQTTDYVSNDPFDAAAHEAALDKLTREVQDLNERFSRIPQYPGTISNTYRNQLLPVPVPVRLLGFDSNGALTTFDPAIRQVTPDAVSGLAWGKSSQTLLASSGVGTDTLTATGLFPAGVLGLGVTLRSTIAFGVANGLGTASLGDASMIDAWGSGINVIASIPLVDSRGRTYYVETVAGQWWRRLPFFAVPAALDVLLRADTGLFSSVGSCVVTAHYLTVTPD